MENVSVPKISNFYGFSYAYTVAFRNPITEGIAECIVHTKIDRKIFLKYSVQSDKKKYIAFKIDHATYENRRH